MKTVLIFLFVIVLTLFSEQQCNLEALNNAIGKLVTFTNRLKNVTEDPIDISLVDLKLQEVKNLIGPCINELRTWVQEPVLKNVTIKTRNCFTAPESEKWKNDPCCNNQLSATQCCVPRDVTITIKEIPDVVTQKIDKCVEKKKAIAALRYYYRKMGNREETCKNTMKIEITKNLDIQKRMLECYSKMFEVIPSCVNDEDCPSGSCNRLTSMCDNPGLYFDQKSKEFAKCVIEVLPEPVKKAMIYKYTQITTSIKDDIEKLTDILLNKITSEKCIGDGIAMNLFESQCKQLTRCTDGTLTCFGSGSFCGLDCNRFTGICKAFKPLVTEQECVNIGLCFDRSEIKYTNRTDCESQSYCTLPKCYESGNCDKSTCEALGFCVGFPKGGVCSMDPVFNQTTGETYCDNPEFHPDIFGCVKKANETECGKIQNTKWIPEPTTQNDCLKYQRCVEGMFVSSKSTEQCNLCEGKMVSLFKWINGQWVPRKWKQIGEWKVKETKPLYYWGKAIDYKRFFEFVSNALSNEINSILLKFAYCYVEPTIQLIKPLACSCIDKKNQCFENIKTKIIEYKLFKNMNGSATIDFEDGTVTIYPSNTGSDIQDVTIEKQFLISDSSDLPTRIFRVDNLNPIYVMENNKEVGQLVGDGISVSGGADKKEICLNVDGTISYSSKYDIPILAVASGTSYVDAKAENVKYENGNICGTVTGESTYYPAYRTNNIPVVGSANKISFGIITILLLFSIFF